MGKDVHLMAQNEMEQGLLNSISVDEMWQHLEQICSWDRLSGGPGEAAAVDYVVEVLKGYGLPVQVYEFDAYLSNPVFGGVEMLGEETRSMVPPPPMSSRGSS
jgi:hypothetical protein